MLEITVKASRKERLLHALALYALSLAMVAAPQLCLPFALLTPLLGCPLVKRKQRYAAWVAACAPVIASLMAGYPALYAYSLFAIGGFPLLLATFLPLSDPTTFKDMLRYVTVIAAALAGCVFSLVYTWGDPLSQGLTERFVSWISQSPRRDEWLYRLGVAGVLNLPEDVLHPSGALLLPVHVPQMILSLRLGLSNMFETLLPSLLVQSAVVLGVLTPLHMQRLNGFTIILKKQPDKSRKHIEIPPPSFRMMTLPKMIRFPLLLLAMVGVMMLTSQGVLWQMMGQMLFTLFETLYRLEGAAVVVFALCLHNPEKAVFSGILAGLLFVIAPTALFVIGVADEVLLYRTKRFEKLQT